jgi:hypothetical protein
MSAYKIGDRVRGYHGRECGNVTGRIVEYWESAVVVEVEYSDASDANIGRRLMFMFGELDVAPVEVTT